MATPELITLPASSCFASMVFSMRRVVGLTASPFSLDEQTFKWPGAQWIVEFDLPPIKNRTIADEWISFGLNLEGRYNYFLLGDPLGRIPKGVATGSPLVDGAGHTGNLLPTKGWTPNTPNIMMAGDWLQLGTGVSAKLHRVTQNVNSDAGGNALLKIQGPIKVSPADNQAIIVNNAQGLFRLSSNDFSHSVNTGPIHRFSFQAAEVI